MGTRILFPGIFAWMALGAVMGFVSYSVLSMYSASAFSIAILSGIVSSAITLLLYIEQESNINKFFVGLCALALSGLAAAIKYFAYDLPVEYTAGTLLIGIMIGLTISIALVAYLIKD